MQHARTRPVVVGLSLAAALLMILLVSAARAAPRQSTANLIRNPGAEDSPGVACTDNAGVRPPVSWQTAGALTAIRNDCVPATGGVAGSQYFTGGPTHGTSTATQNVDLAPYAAAVDGGSTRATLSALIGGYAEQGDYAIVAATFFDRAGSALKTVSIGPVTPDQRSNRSVLLPRSLTETVPAGARTARVVLTAVYVAGAVYNDGSADNISLTLQLGPPAAPKPAPKPNPRRPLHFSAFVKGKPLTGGKTLFPSFTGTRLAGSGAFAQKATYLQDAVGTIVVEQGYFAIPDVKVTIVPTGEGGYIQGKGAYVRMKVRVTRSNFTGCRSGRRGQIVLVDSATRGDSVSIVLCGDSLVYKNGSPRGTTVKVVVGRA